MEIAFIAALTLIIVSYFIGLSEGKKIGQIKEVPILIHQGNTVDRILEIEYPPRPEIEEIHMAFAIDNRAKIMLEKAGTYDSVIKSRLDRKAIEIGRYLFENKLVEIESFEDPYSMEYRIDLAVVKPVK